MPSPPPSPSFKSPPLATQELDGGRLNKATRCPFLLGTLHHCRGRESNSGLNGQSPAFLQLMTCSIFHILKSEVLLQLHYFNAMMLSSKTRTQCSSNLAAHTVTMNQDELKYNQYNDNNMHVKVLKFTFKTAFKSLRIQLRTIYIKVRHITPVSSSKFLH